MRSTSGMTCSSESKASVRRPAFIVGDSVRLSMAHPFALLAILYSSPLPLPPNASPWSTASPRGRVGSRGRGPVRLGLDLAPEEVDQLAEELDAGPGGR